MFVYTGNGFSDANGTPFTNPGNNNPLLLGGTGSPVIVNPFQ
jgi:hypothetical protein